MLSLYRRIKSDFYKLRHTSLLWIHILIPLIGTIAFLSYYSISPWNSTTKISGYFEALAIAFPMLVGLVCSMVISQEEQAGYFQEILLNTGWRGTAFLSKLIILISGAILSTAVASTVFGVGFQLVLRQGDFSLSFYVQATSGLIAGSIFLYILHILVSFKYGKGGSIGLGILGSLISAIMLTGLGDKIWQIVPWSWNGRFCDFSVLKQVNPSIYYMLQSEIQRGVISMIAMIFIALVISLFWVSGWEGKRAYE